MSRARLSLPVLALAWLIPATAFADPPATIDVDLGTGVKIALVLVPKGTFTQGSPRTEVGRAEDELAHRVTLSNDVYIGKFPVTRAQFGRFVWATGYKTEAEKGTSGGSGWDGTALVQRRDFTWKTPGFAQTDDDPVTIVTYDDALAFTSWATRATGRSFTLPTEAQWEHAYRAGTTGPYYAGTSESEALALGWFKGNTRDGTRPVGQKKPNAFGLHDLGGNVYEWCLDWYAPYGADLVVDPIATTPDASDKPRRVLRGGSWLKDPKNGRAAARYRNTPGSRNADNGFRVAVGTSVTAALPVPPTTPTPDPLPEKRAAAPPTPSEKSSLEGCLIGGTCFGTMALFGWLMVFLLRVSSKKSAGPQQPSRPPINHRLGRDGFWIDAASHLAGSLVSYRYSDTNGELHDGQVRVDGSPNGQYVYTGHAPRAMLALQLIGAASGASVRPSRSSQSSQSHRHHATSSSSSDDSSFRGYPSAY